WRAYAQKDPLIEFQHEAFRMFTDLMVKIDEQTAERIMKISAMEEQYKKGVFQPEKETFEHREYSAIGTASSGQDTVYDEEGTGPAEVFGPAAPPGAPAGSKEEVTYRRDAPKVGRNDPCPCGSGKKYKKCCGK
ncbi:SEC-C metal-binding domain-containing protein, partial [Candidatus Omnitrophota bacterium]